VTPSRFIRCLVLCAPSAAYAMPSGPVLMVGGVYSGPRYFDSAQTISTQGVLGPTIRIGYELGDIFNSEFSVQLTWATGQAIQTGNPIPVDYSLLTLAGGYTLTFDMPGKSGIADSGIAPYLGVGLYVGIAPIEAHATSGGQDFVQSATAFYLEAHACAGVRYTLANGLAIRAELTFSTYGGFFGWQPSVGVAYRI
jgi:hypothetical protein